MVLKKSNSGLNSGATQRVQRGGFVDPYNRRTTGLPDGTLDIDIQFSSQELSEELSTCLYNIREYLGFSAPHFSSSLDGMSPKKFHNFNRKSHHAHQLFSTFSLSKGANWRLAERIKDLMNDIDFLRKVSKTMEIHFTEKTDHLVSTRGRLISKKTLMSSQILKSAEREEQEKGEGKYVQTDSKNRRRQTYHGRGVQRQQQVSKPRRDDSERNENQDQEVEPPSRDLPTLTITLNNPWLADARASKLCDPIPDYSNSTTYGKKSVNKCKGYRNGVRAPSRSRSFAISEDIEDMEYNRNTFRAEYSQNQNVIIEDGDEGIPESACSVDFADFITTKHVTKRKVLKSQAKEELCPPGVNTCDRPRHDKGSYILVNCDPSPVHIDESFEVIDCSSVISSGITGPTDNQSESNDNNEDLDRARHGDAKKTEPGDLTTRGTAIVPDVLQKQEQYSLLFSKSFICVRAVSAVAGGEDSDMLGMLTRFQPDEISNVTVGDSLPLCFSLCSHNSMSKSYVVGKESSRDEGTWLVALQNSSESHSESFRNKMAELCRLEDQTSLNQLIEVCRETLYDEVDCQDLVTKVNDATKANDVSLQAWGRLSGITRQEVSIHTPGEAAEKLKVWTTQRKEAKASNIDLGLYYSNFDQDFECGVCFSPCSLYGETEEESAMMLTSCGHAHCIGCWKAHVYHSIYNGAPKILCMTTDCDTVVDETTLRSLVPASVMTVWQARLRDHYLETSEYVSWCPNGQCGQLAVSTRAPLKTQFGSPLTCSCQRSWCSNCHADPHWPASCEQMKAYRYLLAKTGNRTEIPVMNTFYQVEVKKCPNCKYPIEKFQGCPSMVCRMCWFNFCWNCLTSAASHNVYNCRTPPSSKLVTFQLANKLVYDLPINFFLESLQANRDLALYAKNYSWLARTRVHSELKYLRHRQHPVRAFGGNFTETDDKTLLDLADYTLKFMKGAMAQIELFYVIMGFVHPPNKTKRTCLTTTVDNKISRLRFILDRLNTHTVGKPLAHIGAQSKQIQLLLRTGASTLEEMFALVPLLQQASRDVDTTWVQTINPLKHLRYV